MNQLDKEDSDLNGMPDNEIQDHLNVAREAVETYAGIDVKFTRAEMEHCEWQDDTEGFSVGLDIIMFEHSRSGPVESTIYIHTKQDSYGDIVAFCAESGDAELEIEEIARALIYDVDEARVGQIRAREHELQQTSRSGMQCAEMLEKNTMMLESVTRERNQYMRESSRRLSDFRFITFIAIALVVLVTIISLAGVAKAGPIADVATMWSATDDGCGRYCTDERRDGAPDRSSYTMTELDVLEFELSVIKALDLYPDLTAEIFIATGWHESSLQRYAVGPGGECGMFQQLPRYMRPESVREELETYDARCDWLQSIPNSVFAFAEVANDRLQRFDSDWSCAYNQGSSYQREYGQCNQDGADYRDYNALVERRARRALRSVQDADSK